MAHYVIGTMTVTDSDEQARIMSQFRENAEACVPLYGGRFVVAGPVVTTLEGDLQADGGSVIEFDDAESVKRWFESPEYQEVLSMRDRFATGFHLVIAKP